MKKIWQYLVKTFFKRFTIKTNVQLEKNIQLFHEEHQEEIKKANDPEKLTHVAIVLMTIQKHFYERGRFTSHELYFFIELYGYSLTKKQFYRVISKFNKFDYIDKIVLDSNNHNTYYVLTKKFYDSPYIKLH
jgi:hypothetical protein